MPLEAAGEAIPSLVTKMIDLYETRYPGDKDFEVNMKHVAGVIYGGNVIFSFEDGFQLIFG